MPFGGFVINRIIKTAIDPLLRQQFGKLTRGWPRSERAELEDAGRRWIGC